MNQGVLTYGLKIITLVGITNVHNKLQTESKAGRDKIHH